ncbi:MAG: helix-hairpin-helix domain-containing protein [Polyangiales bacterium]
MRRIVSLSIPPLVLVALVLVGRWAAKAPSSDIGIVANASAAPLVGDAAPTPETDALPKALLATDAADATPPAIETFADGAVIVDLNLATDVELRRLPGIGPARSRAILELRMRLGRFKAVDDLARIKGFGRAMLRRLRPLTRV